MTLATRCPACGTVFRVVPDQLKVSDGWVRCGRCAEVFDASNALVDLDAPGAPIVAPPAAAAGVVVTHAPAPAANDEVAPSADRREPDAAPQRPEPGHAPEPAAAPTGAQGEGAPFAGTASAPPPPEVAAQVDGSPGPAPVEADRAAQAAKLLPEPRQEAEVARAAAMAAKAKVAEEAGASETPETPGMPGMPGMPGTSRTAEAAFGPARLAASASVVPLPAESADVAAAPAAPPEPASEAPIPGFVLRADRADRWRTPRRRALLAVLALGLAAALAAQIGLHFRDRVAATWPATRPALQAACAAIGCRVEPPRRIEDLSVESSALLRVDGTPLHRLQIVVRNRAATEVRMPAVELSLTDTIGRTLARRVFDARELGAAAPSLPPQGEAALTGTLELADAKVAGYTVELFYP